MTRPPISIRQLARAADSNQPAVRPWLRLLSEYDEEDISERACLIVGAVIAMRKPPAAKKRATEKLFVQLRDDDRPPEEWLVVRRLRGAPEIVDPPVQTYVGNSLDARPRIFDPLVFLELLRGVDR